MTLTWYLKPNVPEEAVGLLPLIFQDWDPRPAKEQAAERYAYGGGWFPFTGFEMNPETKAITYPGDPSHHPIAHTQLRDETIYLYPHSWVAVVQKDGSFEIMRMD